MLRNKGRRRSENLEGALGDVVGILICPPPSPVEIGLTDKTGGAPRLRQAVRPGNYIIVLCIA